jgi:regulatory protein
MTERDPKDMALKRLDVREYSAGEMRSYLQRKGFSKEQAAQAVAELVEENLINDKRYARVVSRHQSTRGKGPMYIMAKLRTKGVSLDRREASAMYQDTASEDELTTARRVLETRYPRAHENQRELQRAYQGLVRRGFTSDVVRQCLKKTQAG